MRRHRLVGLVAFSIVAVVGVGLAGGASKPVLKGTKSLFVFKSSEELQNIQAHSIRLSLANLPARKSSPAIKLEIEPAEDARLTFLPGGSPWNWHEYGSLALVLTNPSTTAVSFSLRVDDSPSADDKQHSATNSATIGPHQTVRYLFPLGISTPMEKGMRGGPAIPGYEPPPFISKERVDESRVTAFHLSFPKVSAPCTLLVSDVHLVPPVSYDGIVDSFGQHTRETWPGKLKAATELAHRRAAEEAELKASPVLPDRDEYGGWASGPQLPATGFFTSTRRDGRWWLVTPGGRLFLSFGVNAINIQEGPTIVEGREKMFTWLPASNDPLAKHWGTTDRVLYGPVEKGRTFNFYEANLERKYGSDFLSQWRTAAVDRLRAWGFNTLANWSDPELYKQKRMPYTATADVEGDFARIASGNDYWGKMVDPFDPKFAQAARESLRRQAKYRDDPWCLGYFVDNEISWGTGTSDPGHFGLVYGTLSGPAESPAKRAFVEQLKQQYQEIEKLNAAWGVQAGSWESLLEQPFRPGQALTPSAREDFSRFLKAFARQYFRVVRDALKEADPNHMYLGCRFAWQTPEAVEASAEFCDVVSFNIYQRRVDPAEWDFVKPLNKPCIIGEFHFGAVDRGMFHTGLVATPNQAARAEMYIDYLRSVVDHPSFVGCGWFEYADEPLTGRTYDGENYSIGLVTVTDTPYPEFIAACKKAHAEAYKRRAGRQ